MKFITRFILPALLAFILLFSTEANAQNLKEAGPYMSYITDQYNNIMNDYMVYTSTVAHGKSAQKVDGTRVNLMQTIKTSLANVKRLPGFEGDFSLRDSAVALLNMTYIVLNEDYEKILDMEEIAEQSYDGMEAYLLAQDKANEKLDVANEHMATAQKIFAGKHNITLIDTKDELSIKMEKAGQVNAYYRMVYLIFFKSYKQEIYLTEAIQKKDLNAIEQNRATLLKYSTEGIATLDTMKAFDGDKSLILSCRNALVFYQKECKEKVPVMTDFLIKQENFEKVKKAFDTKAEKDRTQADVDQYNKGVNDVNEAVANYNNANNFLNENRSLIINGWNKSSQEFLDKHTPKYKAK